MPLDWWDAGRPMFPTIPPSPPHPTSKRLFLRHKCLKPLRKHDDTFLKRQKYFLKEDIKIITNPIGWVIRSKGSLDIGKISLCIPVTKSPISTHTNPSEPKFTQVNPGEPK